MEITRNVILDLLPLYLADEVSADTRALVERYLETDPELAHLAEQSAAVEMPDDVPIPLTMEDKMEAYKEAKKLQFQRTLIWAVVIAVTILSILGLAAVVALFTFSA